MKSFEDWFSQPLTETRQDDELPEGVYLKNGKHIATCRSCDRDYEIDYEVNLFTQDMSYCGRNQWCYP